MNLNPFSALRNEFRRKRRAWRRRGTPHGLILMYHRVSPTHRDPLGMAVSPEHFSQHLEILSSIAEIVPLARLDDDLRDGRVHRPCVAITFDDGYADNLLYAEPLLKHHDAPATVFVATSLIGQTKPFWWDTLGAITYGDQPLPAELRISIGPQEFHSFDHRANRRGLFNALQSRLKVVDHAERSVALAQLTAWKGSPLELDPMARPMTHGELRQLHESKVIEIGAHTRNHPSLPTLSEQDQFSEIKGSRTEIERMLGFSPASFAYPYGDVGLETPALVAKAGFARAYSTVPDLDFAGTDRLLIPRFGVIDWNGESFERHLRREWFA
jgi:peptidoglycan/xylan/chitin deacetylase (PgdA/CDA1 family)